MQYINNIKTGFTVKIDDNGDFSGILRSGLYHKNNKTFAGNINTLTHEEKIKLEGIIESAFPEMRKYFCAAYEALLPGFEGFIVLR